METEITSTPESLAAAAVAIGAACGILSTLILFPLIDRFIRPRFRLERGSALLLLLTAALLIGAAGAGFYWISQKNQEEARSDLDGRSAFAELDLQL